MTAFARRIGPDRFALGNDTFELAIEVDGDGLPRLSRLLCRDDRGADWSPPSAAALGPVLEVDGQTHAPGSLDLPFAGVCVDEEAAGLTIGYRFSHGLQVEHTIRPAADRAAFRTWTKLTNATGRDLGGIGRFDALNLHLGLSPAAPAASYVTGWLDGPRVEAPGRPPAPFAYPSWISPLMYGDQPPKAPELPGGWYWGNLRLVCGERLTRLPLRSGKRSTFDNFPWVAVRDPLRQEGIFAGFEWSGTWRMDVEHGAAVPEVTLSASMDSYVHALAAGQSLTSPPAFVGFFSGDWDEALNASRRYVVNEIMPPVPEECPLVTYDLGPFKPAYYDGTELIWRSEAQAAADLGVELYFVNASWWSAWTERTDFSCGLGDFTDNRQQFPEGLRAVSEYVHGLGMRFGLWFEFERVDIRTAHRGRHPWRPEWLVHHRGHPSRSWCQHVYNLCLGVRAAATWAADNLSSAIEAYGVDHIMIDGNEWAVCDDPTHDHGPADGEWAQIQGLHSVLQKLRDRFPDLLITNSSAQRGDFAMARYSHALHPHDIKHPSSVSRKNNVGVGALYPTGYGDAALIEYPGEGAVSPERLEWRCLNRMMSVFRVLLVLGHKDEAHLQVLRRAIATQKRIKTSLRGDRYVLAPPELLVERDYGEAGSWEAYEYVSRQGEVASVFAFRCLSPDPEHTLRLRGLEPEATYVVDFHSGRPAFRASGRQLMEEGVRCHLERPRRADVLILDRQAAS
ncbi:MAG: alpha-galactosidase [Gemmatimonadota bacterium]